MGIHARRRALAAGAVGVLVLLVAAWIAGGSPGDRSGPPDAAAKLVPAGALAYVHVSTDGSRESVRRGMALAARFPAVATLRTGLLARLTAPGCGQAAAGAHGREAAVAVLATGSLLLLDTGRDGAPGPLRACGAVSAQRLGRFLVVGPTTAVAAARAVAQGHAPALAGAELYRDARDGLPADRFADGFLTAAGLRGVIGARGGLGAVVSTLLDGPALRAIGFAAEARAPGARLTIRRLTAGGRAPASHGVGLLEHAPAGALAALDTGDLGGALSRFGTLVGGLDPGEQRALAGALRGEVALWLTPETPPTAPTLTMMAEHGDPRALPHTLGGRTLEQATVGGRLVVSTRASGIAAARARGPRLRDSPVARPVLGDAPDHATALGFLDFSELLRLGEQTGLDSSRAYRGIAVDLRKVRAVGAVSTGTAGQTTLQVELSIP